MRVQLEAGDEIPQRETEPDRNGRLVNFGRVSPKLPGAGGRRERHTGAIMAGLTPVRLGKRDVCADVPSDPADDPNDDDNHDDGSYES
jgi:hypothetical protein